jgi:hypothetical protein
MNALAQFPAPKFQFSCGERDGFPAVALINTALARYERCRDFPWLVELVILAKEADTRGMPTLEELDHLNATEQQLQEALSPLGTHFIARQTWKGRRMVDFYVADGPAARQLVGTLAGQGGLARSVTVEISRDDNWTTWMPTLIRMCGPATETIASSEEFEQEVLVRIPLRGGQFGSDEEQQAVLALVDDLSAIAAGSGVGKFDGYEFGNSEAMLFAYGADADALFVSLEPTLRSAPVARGAVITKRYRRPDDAEAREDTVTL